MKPLKHTFTAAGCALLLGGALPALAASSEQVHQEHPHDVLFGISRGSDGLIAVGTGGELRRSADGKAWTIQAATAPGTSLFDVSERQGRLLAVGQEGEIFRNAGDGWQEVDAPTRDRLFAVAQGEMGRAVATGAFGTVLYSKDGGASWTQAEIDWPALIGQDYQPHVYNVSFDARGRVFIVGEFGLIARSDDGGQSWTPLHQGDASLFGFALSDSGLAYAVGQSGTVLRSRDGGDSWAAIDSGNEAILMDVAIRPDGKAVATGIRQAISIAPEANRAENLHHDLFLENWYSDVAVLGNEFYAVGQFARVVKISL